MRKVYPLSLLLIVAGSIWSFAAHYPAMAVGILAGGAFGIANTLLMTRLVLAVANPSPKDPIEIAVTFLVKFPLMLGMLGFVLWKGWIDPLGFIIGFPMVLAGALIAAIGHFYIGSGRRIPEGENAGR